MCTPKQTLFLPLRGLYIRGKNYMITQINIKFMAKMKVLRPLFLLRTSRKVFTRKAQSSIDMKDEDKNQLRANHTEEACAQAL